MSKSSDINLSFPYDWSNPEISDETLIYTVLKNTVYVDLVKLIMAYGIDRIQYVYDNNQWNHLTQKILDRMIHNATIGLSSD